MSLGIFFVLSLLFRGSQSARASVIDSSLPLAMLRELKDELDRQCVVAHAVEFSNLFPNVKCLADGQSDNSSSESDSSSGSDTEDVLTKGPQKGPQTLDEGTTLPELVGKYFEGVKLGNVKEGRIREMFVKNEAKAKIKRHCFSLTKAYKHCQKYRATDVRYARVVECVADKLQETSPDDLKLYQRYLVARREATMWTLRVSRLGVRKARLESSTNTGRLLKELKNKTSYAQFKAACHEDTSEQQLRADEDAMIQRMADENDKCTEGDESNRSDSHDDYCPEGTMCDKRRKTNPVRGMKVLGATLVGSFPVFAGIGALTAIALPGVTVAAGFWSGLAMPGKIPLALGAGALASKDLRPSWSCFPATCELDMSSWQCTLSGVSPFNRFSWLPTIGQKCVMETEGKPACKMSLCSLTDYSDPLHNSNFEVFGKIGRHGSDLYNCLSKAGSISSGLELAESLPSGESNTAQSRVSFYDSLLGGGELRGDEVTSG
eukprot:TRINITY_DN26358_c0_g8_i1.p1 TRINITY_DN26358_c0_g8~~TRINITY_DN26358_c0_g8_i1.p1  ORF type:complete len:491 (-),score=43.90 TRINITY_DN26358_c0_g8_i1:82-1554(-)